ncbi:MAG: hypothetical protein INR62_04745 [Rhodospirillales bacterium]|nr:hypothetical protein [Acetobacter sp.]
MAPSRFVAGIQSLAFARLRESAPPADGGVTLEDFAERIFPTMGTGPCSYPQCYGGGFRPCTGFLGTSDSCLNCSHSYSYHA